MNLESSDVNAGHLAWCGLIALHMARKAGTVYSPAQENLYLCRWLAVAEKKRLFRRELAQDIKWLLKEGREKGLSADLPGKLEYLWRANSGDLLSQTDLFRLQHVMHAITHTGICYGVLSESDWEGRHAAKLNHKAPGVFIRKSDLEAGFDCEGGLTKPIAVRITANLAAVDALLNRAGWQRLSDTTNPLLHNLVTVNHKG